MKVKDHFVTDLADLEAQLERAEQRCRQLEKPAGHVNNCLSDVQARDMASRHRQNLMYQIKCVKNGQPIY